MAKLRDVYDRLDDLRLELATAQESERRLSIALVVSHKLLRHYAFLLNSWDDGGRVIPDNLDDWVKRCSEVSDGSD